MRILPFCLFLPFIVLAQGNPELPFRIRKVDEGISYDLIFMPVRAETSTRTLLNYRVSGQINGEKINEMAAPLGTEPGQTESFRTESGVAFALKGLGKDGKGMAYTLEPDTKTNLNWFISKLQARRLEEQRILSHYGFASMTQMKLFQRQYEDRIAKLTTEGSKDPLADAILQARKERAQAARPTTLVDLVRAWRELKGDFHRTCTPIWNKGSYATWDENEQLREVIANISFQFEAFSKIFERKRLELQRQDRSRSVIKLHGSEIPTPVFYFIHNDSRNSVQNQTLIEDCVKYSNLASSLRMPQNTTYSRDDFNQIASITDLLFFASNPSFDYGASNTSLVNLLGNPSGPFAPSR